MDFRKYFEKYEICVYLFFFLIKKILVNKNLIYREFVNKY